MERTVSFSSIFSTRMLLRKSGILKQCFSKASRRNILSIKKRDIFAGNEVILTGS